jgi:hypothetical protein
MKSRLRNVAGHVGGRRSFSFTHSWNFGHRIAEGARVIAAKGVADMRERARLGCQASSVVTLLPRLRTARRSSTPPSRVCRSKP